MKSWLFHVITLCALWGRLSCHHCKESRHSGVVERSTFDCSSRNINQLPVNIASRATELNLAENNINIIPKHAFRHLPNLTRLDMTHSGINLLQKNCFVGLLHLRQLIIPANYLDQVRLPRETFAGLPSLELLDISDQGFLSECEYPVEILQDLKELRTLIVTSQDVPLPDVYGRLPKLTTLILDGRENMGGSKRMNRAAADIFAAIRDSNINTLMIRHAGLAHIEAGAFSNFKNLRALIVYCNKELNVRQAMLTLNQIENTTLDTVVLDGTYHFNPTTGFQVYDINDFCDSPTWKSVKRLSLRHVQLTAFVPRDVNCLSGLQELSVSYNPLTLSVPDHIDDFRNLAHLQSIDISHSNVPGPGYIYQYCRSRIIHFHPDDFFPQVPRLSHVVNSTVHEEFMKHYTHTTNFFMPPSTRYIDASSSNFKRLSTLGKVLPFNSPNKILFLNVSRTEILKPVNGLLVGLSQLQILDASYGVVESIHPEFLKHLPLLRVLNQSHNHLGKGNNNFNAIFSFARRLEEVDVSSNGLSHIDPSSFSNCTMLKHIALRGNTLKHLEITLRDLTSLELVDMSENYLPFLNESFTRELDKLCEVKSISVDIRHNKLICNCESLSFVRWVQTTLVDVIGRKDMTCLVKDSHRRLTDISVQDLLDECSDSRRYVWIHILLGVLILSLVLTMIAVLYVRVRRKRREHSQDQPLLLNEYRYNAAVLFDFEDVKMRTWIHNELVQKVEEKWNLRLFVMHRDECQHDLRSELECVAEAVSTSRNIILCITSNFFNDEYILAQFRIAFDEERSHEKYIFLCFDDFHFPSGIISIQRLVSGGQALQLCWDQMLARVFWHALRRRLQEHEDEGAETIN